MEGRELLQEWYAEMNVPVVICGKLIVARDIAGTHDDILARPVARLRFFWWMTCRMKGSAMLGSSR